VYVDLEHLNSPASGVNGDTGPIGEDIIPYWYTETATHRFKLGMDAEFTAKLVSSTGSEIFHLHNPGDTALVSIPAGKYKLHLISTKLYCTDCPASQPVFIQRDLEIINSAGGAPPQGGYSKDDLNTLLTTRKCVNCNLNGVQIMNKDLSGVDISGAGFSHSFMSRVNMTRGTFNHTDWTDAGANDCIFDSSQFTFTILNRTAFGNGSFINAKFQRLNWDRTGFYDSDFRYAAFDSGAADGGSIDGSDFRYTTFSNVNLREMSAEHTKFTKVTFSNVYMYMMFLANSTMDSTNYINSCYFQHCTVRGTSVKYSNFTNFRADASVYDDANMTGSRFTNVGFAGGSLRAAILVNSIWSTMDINATNMCHQDRTGASFSNVTYNIDTDCWP